MNLCLIGGVLDFFSYLWQVLTTTVFESVDSLQIP